AALQVQINENTAKAAVKQAEGVRDSTKIRADGDAAAIRRVGEAQADAYHAQADVIGSERVALVKVMEQVASGKIKITPDTLLTSTGGDSSGAAGLFSAYLATLLNQKSTNPSKPYVSREEEDFRSALNEPEPPGPASTGGTSPRPKDKATPP
ncbi:MAG TPA: hypothetical protein VGS23_09820, partial [Thermoplasmata archaeon]|nr:hypothetical protein [Thermoplasmata archaeon]